jgi:PilZ domain
MTDSAAPVDDRRRTPRHGCVEEHGIVSAKVRPGRDASIVDVSAGGALVETNHRLLPGTSVELQFETSAERATIRGRVLRCAVAGVRASSMCYRGAIGFDRSLPWFVPDGSGYRVHGHQTRSAQPRREGSSLEIL